MQRLILLGPPGTGKTSTLLRTLETELAAGVPAERIAFLTFTRRARTEAVERVGKMLGIAPKDLPYFRTIHSMAYRALKLREGDVMGREQLVEFGTAMGITFGKAAGIDDLAAEGLGSQNVADAMLALDNLARLRGQNIKQAFNQARLTIEKWPVMQHFSASYAKFKADGALLDFTDVLAEFCRREIRLDIDVSMIDEAQDLSTLQWYAALMACERAQRQYVAGDDDQAIYRWAGADVDTFIALPGERRVLEQSYRLPARVHSLAVAVSGRIRQRIPKAFNPRTGDVGRVAAHVDMESLPIVNGESWLLLVRNRYMLQQIRASLLERGLVYSEHGRSSILEKERDAIYDWERLRKGQAVRAERVRSCYELLTSPKQVARGYKLLPGFADEHPLSMADLQTKGGLLTTATWYDAFTRIDQYRRAYYRRLLRHSGTLKIEPRVQLETIHGAKGAEADNVALWLDQTRRTWDDAQTDPDSENRVWYVGCSRAKQALHVVQATSRWSYTLPKIA